MRKILTSNGFHIGFIAISELILAALLKIDHSLSVIGISIVMAFWLVISHIFVGWIKFIYEFETFKNTKSHTDKILNEFTESNFVTSKVADSVRDALKFDNNIKINTKHIPFHTLLSGLKYDYLKNYFNYNSSGNNPIISKIPRFYFEEYTKADGSKHSIWRWLVERSKSYKSIQVLNNNTSDIYLENENRLEVETNFLKTAYLDKKSKLVIIDKLFVIKDDWLDKSTGQITEENVKNYLKVWKTAMNNMTKSSKKNLQIKYIKLSEAKGAIDNGFIEDIGIFDNILGIQKPMNTNETLINDNADISFYFEKNFISNYKSKFDTIFNSAQNI